MSRGGRPGTCFHRSIACLDWFVYSGLMTLVRLARCCIPGILLCIGVGGCLPGGESQADEQKEAHFLAGRTLVSQMDFQGAMNSFEKALEINPHSASAHFELGCLCEADDPAAAIYHYEQVIKLRPRSSEADLSREHINKCKLEIAKSVSTLGPLPPSTQAEMERILIENRDLKVQLTRWQTVHGGQPPAVTTTNPPAAVPQPVAQPIPVKSGPIGALRPQVAAVAGPTATPPVVRTHTVKSGECPAGIARKYGVSVTALLAANPEAKPTRLRVGQVLNVPAH